MIFPTLSITWENYFCHDILKQMRVLNVKMLPIFRYSLDVNLTRLCWVNKIMEMIINSDLLSSKIRNSK